MLLLQISFRLEFLIFLVKKLDIHVFLFSKTGGWTKPDITLLYILSFFFAVLAFLAKRFSLHGPMTETECKKC